MLKTMTRSKLLLLVILLVAGCAANAVTMKQQSEQYMSIYNMQYEDTVSTLKNPYATATQKEVARKKAEVLTELYPLVKAYDAAVVNGGVPSDETVRMINDLINRLTALATGGK